MSLYIIPPITQKLTKESNYLTQNRTKTIEFDFQNDYILHKKKTVRLETVAITTACYSQQWSVIQNDLIITVRND